MPETMTRPRGTEETLLDPFAEIQQERREMLDEIERLRKALNDVRLMATIGDAAESGTRLALCGHIAEDALDPKEETTNDR